MAGLQSGNIIWEEQLRTNFTAMVNLRHMYCMTLDGQSQGQGFKRRSYFSRSRQCLYAHKV